MDENIGKKSNGRRKGLPEIGLIGIKKVKSKIKNSRLKLKRKKS